MKRTRSIGTIALGAVACVALAACTVDDVRQGQNGNDGDPFEDEGVACEHDLQVTGEVAPAGDPPGPDDGCTPFGTWTVTVALGEEGDCDEGEVSAALEEEYVYVVGEDENGDWAFSYPADPDGDVELLVRATGAGQCVGTFVHHASDGSWEVLLKPYQTELELSGNGTFTRFE